MPDNTNSSTKLNQYSMEFFQRKEWIGIVVTTAFIIGGLYLIMKHGKQAGFWFGFGAALLLVSYLTINSDGSFSLNLGFIGISTGSDKKNTPTT